MVNEQMVNIGVLGCGPVAQFAHLEACQKARNVNLHAVCDVAEDLAVKFGRFYDATHIHTNYEAMLQDPDLDAVIVATADAGHVPASIRAIEAGKHVLVEKPLGTDLDQALALKALVDRSGLVLQVGHMKRFDPGIRFARDFVRQEMGEVIAYKGWYCDSTHRYDMTDSTQPLPLRSDHSHTQTGDPRTDLRRYYMLAHGSHLVDTARFLAGRIVGVRATLVELNGIFSWFVDTEFASGAHGHLDLTVAVRMDWHEGFQIYGEQGSVLGKIHNPWYFKPADVQCFSERDTTYRQLLDNKAHFFQLQVEGFADSIVHSTSQTGTDIDQGIESIRAMMAIAESVRTGERVGLDDVNGAEI